MIGFVHIRMDRFIHIRVKGGTYLEMPILLLDERTDQATKQILENVVKRKRKFDRYKQRHTVIMWMTLFLALIYFMYIYMTIVKPRLDFAGMFSAFVNDSNHLIFLIITIGMYGYMNLLKEKMEKAEKEFHALRCEIVERSKDFWKNEDAWNNRHLVFEMMKKNYDINLYHEKK